MSGAHVKLEFGLACNHILHLQPLLDIQWNPGEGSSDRIPRPKHRDALWLLSVESFRIVVSYSSDAVQVAGESSVVVGKQSLCDGLCRTPLFSTQQHRALDYWSICKCTLDLEKPRVSC